MTAAEHIVVGSGNEATLVAATLIAAGHAVTLIRTGASLPTALACVHRSTWRRLDAPSELATRVLGPTTTVTPHTSGVLVAGGTHALPLSPLEVGRILPTGHRREAARSWIRARARNALAVVVGGGQEERTYRDWVVRRMGSPAYDVLYADYAERRWGRSGHDISASMARVAHSPALATERVAPADVRDHETTRAEALLSTHGGRVYEASEVRFEVEGRTLSRINLGDENVDVEDRAVWAVTSPAVVARWLGASCPASARHLAAGLATVPSLRVRLSGARDDVPDELHVLDPAPCWRFVRAPDDRTAWLVSATGSLSSALLEDIRDFAVQSHMVRSDSEIVASAEVPGGVPVWGPVDHARLRTVLDAYSTLGIRLSGSAGTLTPLDPTALVAHVEALLETGPGELQEAWRMVAAPPTLVEDLGARITHFFADA